MEFHYPTPEFMNNLFSNCMGYTVIFVHEKTNEIICDKCALKLFKNPDTENNILTDYVFTGYEEGEPLQCARCKEMIESDYGDPQTGGQCMKELKHFSKCPCYGCEAVKNYPCEGFSCIRNCVYRCTCKEIERGDKL